MFNSKDFDIWAKEYDKSVEESNKDNTYPFAGYDYVLDFIYKEIVKRENPRILDIGLGTGKLSKKLYDRGFEIYGQDFSQNMLEQAKKEMPEAKLFIGDFSKGLVKALTEKKYDYIIATYSLHHLTDKEKESFIEKLSGYLNKEGKILIGDVAFENEEELEECKRNAKDAWDEEEIYFVADRLRKKFPKLVFNKISHCSGVIII